MNHPFWKIAEWEKSGVINKYAFWNIAEWEKSGVMMSIPKKTAKTVEPDAPPFGTGRIKTTIVSFGAIFRQGKNVNICCVTTFHFYYCSVRILCSVDVNNFFAGISYHFLPRYWKTQLIWDFLNDYCRSHFTNHFVAITSRWQNMLSYIFTILKCGIVNIINFLPE